MREKSSIPVVTENLWRSVEHSAEPLISNKLLTALPIVAENDKEKQFLKLVGVPDNNPWQGAFSSVEKQFPLSQPVRNVAKETHVPDLAAYKEKAVAFHKKLLNQSGKDGNKSRKIVSSEVAKLKQDNPLAYARVKALSTKQLSNARVLGPVEDISLFVPRSETNTKNPRSRLLPDSFDNQFEEIFSASHKNNKASVLGTRQSGNTWYAFGTEAEKTPSRNVGSLKDKIDGHSLSHWFAPEEAFAKSGSGQSGNIDMSPQKVIGDVQGLVEGPWGKYLGNVGKPDSPQDVTAVYQEPNETGYQEFLGAFDSLTGKLSSVQSAAQSLKGLGSMLGMADSALGMEALTDLAGMPIPTSPADLVSMLTGKSISSAGMTGGGGSGGAGVDGLVVTVGGAGAAATGAGMRSLMAQVDMSKSGASVSSPSSASSQSESGNEREQDSEDLDQETSDVTEDSNAKQAQPGAASHDADKTTADEGEQSETEDSKDKEFNEDAEENVQQTDNVVEKIELDGKFYTKEEIDEIDRLAELTDRQRSREESDIEKHGQMVADLENIDMDPEKLQQYRDVYNRRKELFADSSKYTSDVTLTDDLRSAGKVVKDSLWDPYYGLLSASSKGLRQWVDDPDKALENLKKGAGIVSTSIEDSVSEIVENPGEAAQGALDRVYDRALEIGDDILDGRPITGATKGAIDIGVVSAAGLGLKVAAKATKNVVPTPGLFKSGKVFREDDLMYYPGGKQLGSRKSHIDAEGNMQPANPSGNDSVISHVRGGGKDSALTSFKQKKSVGKKYGDQMAEVDIRRLKRDIKNGDVADVEVIEHKQVLKEVDNHVAKAKKRYDDNPSIRNNESLKAANRNRFHVQRDKEVLIKGKIPEEYIKE